MCSDKPSLTFARNRASRLSNLTLSAVKCTHPVFWGTPCILNKVKTRKTKRNTLHCIGHGAIGQTLTRPMHMHVQFIYLIMNHDQTLQALLRNNNKKSVLTSAVQLSLNVVSQ